MNAKTFLLRILLLISGLVLFLSVGFTQSQNERRIIRFSSKHTSFPDSARSHDYVYDSVHYSSSDHYSDSTLLMIIPPGVKRDRHVDLVFWFHGWYNNVDTALRFYEIERQFLESKKNAVLVLAETAKNAPDSYGGKLEKKGVFKQLTVDIIESLKKENIIGRNSFPGKITLAGHSGAYRVIAHMLVNGDMPVSEVILFDALYGQTDKYLSWIQQEKKHRFINWYTNQGGGTDEVSIQMMKQLQELQIPFQLVEEASVGSDAIRKNRILFVHSPRGHNVIINRPDNLKLLLENSSH